MRCRCATVRQPDRGALISRGDRLDGFVIDRGVGELQVRANEKLTASDMENAKREFASNGCFVLRNVVSPCGGTTAKVVATEPTNDGNQFRIERRGPASQCGETVLDEAVGDLGVLIGVAGVHNRTLLTKYTKGHRQRRHHGDGDNDRSVPTPCSRHRVRHICALRAEDLGMARRADNDDPASIG